MAMTTVRSKIQDNTSLNNGMLNLLLCRLKFNPLRLLNLLLLICKIPIYSTIVSSLGKGLKKISNADNSSIKLSVKIIRLISSAIEKIQQVKTHLFLLFLISFR